MSLRNLTAGACAVVAIACTSASTAKAAVNLIANGSFESPTGEALNTTTLAVWQRTGQVDVVNENIGWGLGIGKTPDGEQYLDLAGSAGPGSISQSFATVAGQNYLLSFIYSNTPGSNIDPLAPVTAVASFTIDGVTTPFDSDASNPNIPSNATIAWETGLYFFEAVSNFTTLTFSSEDGSYYAGMLIDSVSVTATPEPTSIIAWSGLALGACGIYWKRRQS